MRLSEQHEMMRDTVRRYARERLWPNAARWERERHFPRAEFVEMAQMGLNAVAVRSEERRVG